MSSNSKPIVFLYLLLFFATPLIFTSVNSELFELPKMYFVYSITLLILIFHLFNFFRGRVPLFRRTFFDLPLSLFLISQTISTIFSIDLHTSFFGYYSRLNGGLLSLLAYSLLYWILAVYINDNFKKYLINVFLFSGILVAAFGIAEHFGIDKNLWVQDVQNRVFSTLGQPNWLAAYLCILLPFAVDKFLNQSKSLFFAIYYSSLVISFYLCLLFTKSKSGLIAAIVSLGIYFVFRFFQKDTSKKLLIINYSFLVLLSLFINNPIKDYLFPHKIENYNLKIENLNITPSADIRRIVWQGSLKLWQQFPVFGTGPETFAYTYYWTRPASHNLTSEWDFLYNKAHNEYLNYLATTGTFGFITYLTIIIAALISFLRRQQYSSFAAYLSILITNLAGFSVVITSLFFFLLPLFSAPLSSTDYVTKPKLIIKISSLLLILVSGFLFLKNFYFYLADIAYNQSTNLDNSQKYSGSYQQILFSLQHRPHEPVYLSQAAVVTSKLAILAKNQHLTDQTQKYTETSLNFLDQATAVSPFSLNLLKEKAQTCYYLSAIDSKYYLLSLDALTKATKLAPTDARSFYMLGEFYQNIGETSSAIDNYTQAIRLKPNYDHAYFAIAKIYFDQKNYSLAKTNFENALHYAPTNTEAQNYLQLIATASAGKK